MEPAHELNESIREIIAALQRRRKGAVSDEHLDDEIRESLKRLLEPPK